jgi:hypothetical protein
MQSEHTQNDAVSLSTSAGAEGEIALGLKPLSRRPTPSIDPESNTKYKIIPQDMRSGTPGVKKNTPEKALWSWEDANSVSGETREFLKCYFIRTRPDREVKDLLYGKIASGKCPRCGQGVMTMR